MNCASAFHGWMGGPLIVIGLVVALAACSWLAIIELRKAGRRAPAEGERQPSAGGLNRTWISLLVLALVVGTFVRVTGLDAKGLSHPEAYIPGIDLPAGISDPPPRHAFVETAVWHFRSEPHPFGYYLAMWAWTKVFGASLTSIRTPGMLLGVLSIFLIYQVGASAYGPRVGVVAAGLLSLHGFHIFWSQAARMWVPGACLGLLSTWLLLEMTRARRPRPGLEGAYVLTTVAGAMTIEFYWVLLCVQMLWTALSHRQTSSRIPRAAVTQALAFMLSAPMLSHAMMLGRQGAAPPPSLEFLRDYFSFGFLFQHGAFDGHFFKIPIAVSIAVLAASIALVVLGLRVSTREDRAEQAQPASMWPLVLCAGGMLMVMLGIAGISHARSEALVALSVLPLLALSIPFAAGSVTPLLRGIAPSADGRVQRLRIRATLIPLLACVPPLLIFAVSYRLSLTAPRAFVVFVPYLLIVIAAGAVAISGRRLVAAGIAILLVTMFSVSAVVLRNTPVSPRDYQGLSRALNARLQSGDLIFTRRGDWAYTPIFFYLDHDRLVAEDFSDALRTAPRSRVWVLSFLRQPPTDDMTEALSGYQIAGRTTALNAEAVLYVPAR